MTGRLRGIVAVVVGFMAMMVLVSIANAFAVLHFAGRIQQPTTGYLAYRVLSALLAAFGAGLMTGWIAGEQRRRHGYALGAVILVLTAMSNLRYGGGQMPWYQAVLVAGAPACAVLGAWAVDGLERLRQRGAILQRPEPGSPVRRRAGKR